MTPRLRLVALVVAATLVVAGCTIRMDYDDVRGADYAYVDPDGVWRIIGDPTPLWTQPGGQEVVGDFDGDGRSEPASYDWSTGMWHTAGGRGSFAFPAPADADPATDVWFTPVPADYDGDGDDDPALYVEDSATWLIEGQAPFVFGRPTGDASTPVIEGFKDVPLHDVAVPGDYDGDGTAEPAVYRIETGEIHVMGDPTPIDTGLPFALPVPADYTADPGIEAGAFGLLGEGWAVDGQAPVWPFPIPANGPALPGPADYDPSDATVELAIVDHQVTESWYVEGAAPVALPTGISNVRTVPVTTDVVQVLVLTVIAEECLEAGNPTCP